MIVGHHELLGLIETAAVSVVGGTLYVRQWLRSRRHGRRRATATSPASND